MYTLYDYGRSMQLKSLWDVFLSKINLISHQQNVKQFSDQLYRCWWWVYGIYHKLYKSAIFISFAWGFEKQEHK